MIARHDLIPLVPAALGDTDLPLPGKVRDWYPLAEQKQLIIRSAHKTAEHGLNILAEYEADPRSKVYITVAGRSNARSGFSDGAVSAAVIACPPPSDAFRKVDVFSSLRMPLGIVLAVVLEPVNAALLAAKILGLVDPAVREAVGLYQMKQADKITDDDTALHQLS